MKIKPEDYDYLRSAVRAAQAAHPTETRAKYEQQGLTAKRHRWDLVWSAKLGPWLCGVLYPYGIKDDHIDTALRAIVKELETRS